MRPDDPDPDARFVNSLSQFVTAVHGARISVARNGRAETPSDRLLTACGLPFGPTRPPWAAPHHLGLCHRSTEMGPRALVLALLPTAVAANKGNEVIKFVVIGAAVLIFFGLIIYRQYKYATWSAKRSTTVTAPAGKAGLLFDATATPPTVTGLAALSPLRGEVEVGWRLAKVDDVDVSTMTGGEATRLLEARAANARRLEFDRTLAPLPNYNHGA